MDTLEPLPCPSCGLNLSISQCLCEIKNIGSLSIEKKNSLFKQYVEIGENLIIQENFTQAKASFLQGFSLDVDNKKIGEYLQNIEAKIREQHFERLVQEAQKLMKEDQLETAKAKLETALIFKSDPEIRDLLALLRINVGKKEFKNLMEEGNLFFEVGALKEALECWEKALKIKKEPTMQFRYNQIQDTVYQVAFITAEAQEIGEKGDWKQASKHLEKAFALYPEDYDLLIHGAVFTSNRDEYKKHFKEATSYEKRFFFIRAWTSYQILLGISPEDQHIKKKLFYLQIKIMATSLFLSLAIAWSILNFL